MVNMKTKAITEGLRENGFPRVCQKSTLISKNSYSCRQSAKITELDASIYQDVAPSPEVPVEDTIRDEAVHHEACLDAVAVDFELQKKEFGSIDPTITERMELTAANWQSKIETICSPVLDPAELHNVMDVFNSAERRDDPDMPPLLADESDDSRRSSCDYQTINVSDFSIYDMIVAGGAFAGNELNSEIDWRNLYTDHQCAESTTLLDMCEQYMPLRFLEDAVEKSNTQDLKSSEETFVVLDAPGLNLGMDLKPRDQDSDADLNSCSNQLECFDPDEIIEYLSDASNFWCPTPKLMCKKKSITLVLDLDETLIHSTVDHCDNADFTFPVSIKLKEHIVYVKRRPFLQTFLERVAEMFKVVVFTASESIYAKELLDILDPEGKLIGQRFYRESCTFSDGYYAKDLTVIGVELAKVAIIDNSPQVFRLQVNNGIPIKSWFDDPSDHALISLLPFLESLVEVDDVRPIIANRYGNTT